MLGACAHSAKPKSSAPGATAWMDGDLVGAAVRDEPSTLAELGSGTATQRLARLDRLLDLYDAARFAADSDALDTLWLALGGHTSQQGPEASREAALRILEAGLALEDASDALDEDGRVFLADLIMLVSADLELPETAEQLQVQTLAYRTVAEHGHPRIADNARWRLYDHVRGCMDGTVEAPPELRLEVASHALYVTADDISPQLEDVAPHERPLPPTAGTLVALLGEQRTPLLALPRWKPVLERRAAQEKQLEEDLALALPAARSFPVALAQRERGTGRAESYAPIVVAAGGQLTVDWGHPGARALGSQEGAELAPLLEAVNARDGRGTVLLVAEPILPAPALAQLLTSAHRARLTRLELALHEEALPPRTGAVVTALPLGLASMGAPGPAGEALRAARIRVHLDGRGSRVAFDGRWLHRSPEAPHALGDQLDALDRAFPRERVAVLTVADDVLYQQLLDLVAGLVGGLHPHYDAVVLAPDAPAPPPREDRDPPKVLQALETRASLYVEAPVKLDQAFPLRKEDQVRLEALAGGLRRCTPELELRPSGKSVRVDLVFEDGRLADVEPWRLGRGQSDARDRLAACVKEETTGFRLRHHRDRVKVTVLLPLPPR